VAGMSKVIWSSGYPFFKAMPVWSGRGAACFGLGVLATPNLKPWLHRRQKRLPKNTSLDKAGLQRKRERLSHRCWACARVCVCGWGGARETPTRGESPQAANARRSGAIDSNEGFFLKALKRCEQFYLSHEFYGRAMKTVGPAY